MSTILVSDWCHKYCNSIVNQKHGLTLLVPLFKLKEWFWKWIWLTSNSTKTFSRWLSWGYNWWLMWRLPWWLAWWLAWWLDWWLREGLRCLSRHQPSYDCSYQSQHQQHTTTNTKIIPSCRSKADNSLLNRSTSIKHSWIRQLGSCSITKPLLWTVIQAAAHWECYGAHLSIAVMAQH